MKEHADTYRIGKMAKTLGVSRSGYYEFKKRKASQRKQDDEKLIKEIFELYMGSNMIYGSRKITKELNKRSKRVVNHKRIERLMKEYGLRSKVSKKYVVTTNSDHNNPLSEDLLRRDFTAGKRNEKWVSDTTYLWTGEGWLYIACILDLYGRKIVGLATSDKNDRELVTKALRDASGRIGKKRIEGCILHSDRGSTYCSKEYIALIEELKLKQSMSRKGNCWDNAPMESFWGKMKMEWFDEILKTRKEAIDSVYEYVWIFYNRKRTHATNGYVTPEEYYSQVDTAA
jgi:putative transposase